MNERCSQVPGNGTVTCASTSQSAVSAPVTRTAKGTISDVKHDKPATSNKSASSRTRTTNNGGDEAMLAEPAPMKQEKVYDSEDSESESDESESSYTTSTAESNIERVAESTNGRVDGGDGTDAARHPPVPKATTRSGAKVRSYSYREPQTSKIVSTFGYVPAASAQVCSYRIYTQRQIECDAAAADACRRVPPIQSDEEEAHRIRMLRPMIKTKLLDDRSVKYVSRAICCTRRYIPETSACSTLCTASIHCA